jgi:hypothetical protein
VAEVAAAGGQLTDQVVEVLVVRVAVGLGSQNRDAGVGGALPVGVGVVGVGEVEEGEAGEIGLCAGCGVVDGGVHGRAEVVAGEQIHASVADVTACRCSRSAVPRVRD